MAEESIFAGIRRSLAEVVAPEDTQVVEDERLEVLEAESRDRRIVRRELEDLAYTTLDYFGGNEQDMTAVARRKIVQQSRVGWQRDPQIGAAVDLYNDFTLGRGVPKAKARDPKVQDVIDEAWEDEDNKLILTTYEAQMQLNTDLTLQSNLFILEFSEGEDGKVKLSMLDHDTVEQIVRDKDNRRRHLWYLTRPKMIEFDFVNHTNRPIQNIQEKDRVKYFAHWSHEAPEGQKPEPAFIGKGKVFHVAINRTGEMAFGHPVMHRVLRWSSAFNSLMEARVDMARAAAALVMKRKVKGTKNQVEKQATQALSRRSQLGRAVNPEGEEVLSGPGAASILNENEGVEYETFSLDSKAANANTDGQMIRSQISAATHFPQHYLGDIGSANLATACHDAQTETLTEDGWLTLADLKARADCGDLPRVAAYDPAGDRVLYHAPKGGKLHLYPYRGRMARFAGRASDMLVTPNHRMLVRAGDSSKKLGGWEKIEAQDLGKRRVYERRAARLGSGVRVETFVLPGVEIHHGQRNGGTRVLTERSALELPMDAWLRWMGWYISEGSGDAEVAQAADSPRLAACQEACAALGVPGKPRWKGRADCRMWHWRPENPKQFRAWLEENVGTGAHGKRLPAFVFDLAVDQQEALLEGLMGGDGLNRPLAEPGYTAYFTSSRQLADDVQRLALHAGFRTRLRGFERRGMRPEYVVGMTRGEVGRLKRDAGWSVLPKPEWENYDGEVYCFSTPDDTMITRRNGIVAFHCNTSMELPVLKAIESRQEIVEGIFRWFIDRVIKRALEKGKLSATLSDEEYAELKKDQQQEGTEEAPPVPTAVPEATGAAGPPTSTTEAELTLDTGATAEDGEGVDEGENEDRKRDLSYDFSLPSPLRRMLSELITGVSEIAKTFDPNGTNMELSRTLLAIVLGEGLEMADPGEVVEKVFPPGYKDPAMAMLQAQTPRGGGEAGGGGNPFGSNQTDAEGNPYSAPMKATTPEEVREAREQERAAERKLLARGGLPLEEAIIDRIQHPAVKAAVAERIARNGKVFDDSMSPIKDLLQGKG